MVGEMNKEMKRLVGVLQTGHLSKGRLQASNR